MEFDNEIVFRIPAPSDGIETVLVLFGIGAFLFAVLAGFQHRETVKRIWKWVTAHPWEKASATVNLLSWGALIFVGPVAAVLFVMAVGEAYALLQQEGGSESGVGSLGRGAVIVALIGAPFVIWRSVVAQKTVNVTEQGHITDRINTAVQGLGAEKTVKRQRKRQTGALAYAKGEDDKPDYSKPIMEEVTEPNLEVRIGAIFALERIAQDSDRDHVQIMEILCSYIRENAALENPFRERNVSLQRDDAKIRSDIVTALKVIGRRSAKQVKVASDFLRQGTYRKRFDLTKVNLADADLRDLKFSDIDFSRSSFRFANMLNTKWQNVSFNGSDFSMSDTRNSKVEGQTIFSWCLFQGFESLHVTKEVTGAETIGCALRLTNFPTSVEIKDVFQNKARGLSGWFGDHSITVNQQPLDQPPPKWPCTILDEQEFIALWHKWQANPEG